MLNNKGFIKLYIRKHTKYSSNPYNYIYNKDLYNKIRILRRISRRDFNKALMKIKISHGILLSNKKIKSIITNRVFIS